MNMRFGPEWDDEIANKRPQGDCPDCGGECSPECGKHPLGCFYGGMPSGWWMIAEGCELYHGEKL
jgi:hypothetical protein